MLVIPLSATPSQTATIILGGQQCRISLFQKTTGLYMDLFVDENPLFRTKLCTDRDRMVRHGYQGFIGNLAFVDTQGKSDPEYLGIGTRYQLIYLESIEG